MNCYGSVISKRVEQEVPEHADWLAGIAIDSGIFKIKKIIDTKTQRQEQYNGKIIKRTEIVPDVITKEAPYLFHQKLIR
jgi:hypothetical protein